MSDMEKRIQDIASGLNDAQKSAVLSPCESCTKIVAGAGTGKTKIISKRFTKLVFELEQLGIENPQSRILVITFTDKAANEMKERIVKELDENEVQISGLSDNELWISTFHSFCIKILRKYSIEAGLSPSFRIADEKELKKIYDNLIKQIKYGETAYIENAKNVLESYSMSINDLSVNSINMLNKIDDLDNLFEDIYEIIKKIKSLGINPSEFLNKSTIALKNYSEVVENIPFKFDSKEDYVQAWKEQLSKYIDDYCDFDEKIFDDIAKEKVILDKFGKRKAIEYGMAQGFPENIKPVTDIELRLTRIICAIYALYQAELERADLADFDDLINKTIQIFKENELIRSYYQKYFKHIIVDEFQDTNGAQLELIELLLNPQNPDLTYVGDRKQSIYGFRFAQMENLEVLFENIKKRYKKNYKPISLSINYRSTPEVLNAVNYVTEKELCLEGENLFANPNQEFSKTDEDIKVTLIEGFENSFEHKQSEAAYIAEEIQRLIKRDNAEFKEFSVLVKSHAQADIVEKELKKYNIPSVKKVNTGYFNEPVVKNAVSGFRLVKNINDEQAFFRLLKVVMSDSEIYRLKKNLDRKLSEKIEFEELKKMNFVQKFILLKSEPEYENTYAAKLFELLNNIRKNKDSLSLLQTYEILKNNLVFFNESTDFENSQALKNLKILEMIIDDFSQNENYISISALLDYLDNAKEDKSFELPSIDSGEVNAVQILTIHASKGLEFKYVFVLSITSASKTTSKSNILFDMQFGNKPGFGVVVNKYRGKPNPKAVLYKHIWQKPRDLNEALRLFYVAVSRAKSYLNILSFEPYSSIKPVEYIISLNDYLNC